MADAWADLSDADSNSTTASEKRRRDEDRQIIAAQADAEQLHARQESQKEKNRSYGQNLLEDFRYWATYRGDARVYSQLNFTSSSPGNGELNWVKMQVMRIFTTRIKYVQAHRLLIFPIL